MKPVIERKPTEIARVEMELVTQNKAMRTLVFVLSEEMTNSLFGEDVWEHSKVDRETFVILDTRKGTLQLTFLCVKRSSGSHISNRPWRNLLRYLASPINL